MKYPSIVNGLIIAALLLPALPAKPQKALSFDVAAIRNTVHQLNGLNVSSFYHFNERLTGGVEMNRFFSITQIKKAEEVTLSAWDFDLNFHYLMPLSKKIKCYPLAGVSHTSEKELNRGSREVMVDRFWSFNTGAGLLYQQGRWAPHLEYMFTWGQMNQQFLLAGISYELEWEGKEK